MDLHEAVNVCLLAIYYRHVPGAPIVLAANRDESRRRPSLSPDLREDQRLLCGLDAQAGGTWLGVNADGLVVAVTNRPAPPAPAVARSRGLLAMDLLHTGSASKAVELAMRELDTEHYAGVNYLCTDAQSCAVVCGGLQPQVIDMPPGLHLLTNGDPDDVDDSRQKISRRLMVEREPSRVEDFLNRAKLVFSGKAHPPTAAKMVLNQPWRGTISSTIIAITDDPHQAAYLYADGPPDSEPYCDYSHMLRAMLAR
ncbi:MAG: NRDE family protein [Pirellulales bacterium]